MEKMVYSVIEVASLLGISKSLAYTLVKKGEIPSIKLGTRVVIPKVRFQAYLDGKLENN